jgi:hypothetical protein
MKISELRVMLKEVVKEVFHEELKEILLEAIKSPKQQIVEYQSQPTTITQSNSVGENNLGDAERQTLRENYKNLIEGPSRSPQSQKGFRPSGYINTASESSEMPEGEVSLDQISQFIMPKQ